MTVQQAQDVTSEVTETFVAAMTRLVSGVAVVTSRTAHQRPCGLLVSSLSSYSISPPSVLFAIDRASRCYPAMVEGPAFGVHVLAQQHLTLARTFAGRGEDKFADVAWEWDQEIPRIPQVPVYLHCRKVRVFRHGDHALVIGNVAEMRCESGEPLVYYQRELRWRLEAAGSPS